MVWAFDSKNLNRTQIIQKSDTLFTRHLIRAKERCNTKLYRVNTVTLLSIGLVAMNSIPSSSSAGVVAQQGVEMPGKLSCLIVRKLIGKF